MDGLKHGYGEEVWPNGVKFEGDFVKGNKEGNGIFHWTDGGVFKG